MTPRMPDALPENVDWEEIASQFLDEVAVQLADIIIEAVKEHSDDIAGHVRARTEAMAWVPVTFPDLLGAALQTQEDLRESPANEDLSYETLVEGLTNFATMHRYSLCECGHDPCIAIIPRDVLVQRAAAMGRL